MAEKKKAAKRPKLTAKRKADYLATGGNRCPYCHSERIESGPVETSHLGYSAIVDCHECGRVWTDIYSVTDVAEIDCEENDG